MTTPSGEEREVKFLGSASIDGAPVAYIVVLAAVVTVLAFIPFSIVMASGGSFPMSQAIYPLLGWLLGPIGGAVAGGIGRTIGVFLAPHTASLAPISILGAVLIPFIAGTMTAGGKRAAWWLAPALLGILSAIAFLGRGIWINGVSVQAAFLGSAAQTLGLMLFILPTRILCARGITSKNLALVFLGLFFGNWASFAGGHLAQSALNYWVVNWPEEIWITLAGLMPIEYIFRSLIGSVIGVSVIAGLRAIGLKKAENALY